MSVPSKIVKTFDAQDRSGQRLCWLLDMHGVELAWPDGLSPFVHRLQTDRHLAMDFWALIRSLRRSETAELSNQQLRAIVVSCVCGKDTLLPRSHDDKVAMAHLTNMIEAANASTDPEAYLPDALAPPDGSEGRPVAMNRSRNFSDEPAQPRIHEFGPPVDDVIAPSDPTPKPGLPLAAALSMSEALSHHLDEALSRLELNSLELKVHLDNLDSRMSRIEPHLEDLTSLVASTLSAPSLHALKPGMSTETSPLSSPGEAPLQAALPKVSVPAQAMQVEAKPEAPLLPAYSPVRTAPRPSPEYPIASATRAAPVAPPEPQPSWSERASEWWSNSTIARWPGKAKTAWGNTIARWPEKATTAWSNRPQWKSKLPALPPHLLPNLKQRWLDSAQFVSARRQNVHPRHIAIASSVLVAGFVGGAVLVGTHHHSVGVSVPPPPRDLKVTAPPLSKPTPEAGTDAIPSQPAASNNLQPSPSLPANAEKVKADEPIARTIKSAAVSADTPQTDKPTKRQGTDLIAKPTFKWLGDDSETPEKNDKNGTNSIPKTAVLGEKAAAPAPKAVGTDTSPSAEPLTVSPDVMAANLLLSPSPAYPQMAKLTHQQGPVVVQAVISKDGKVDNVHVVKGHVLLRHAATTAVMNWRYRPYVLNGQPVNVATTITVNFSSPGASESSTDNSN